MIHTKLLIRRLAYVPWMLAVGLVVGWAGEAEAALKAVTLNGKKTISVREDAGEQKIKVKVTSDKVKVATSVTLTLDADGTEQLNKRFRIALPSLVIAAAGVAAEGEITFEPINDNKRGDNFHNAGAADDLKITIDATGAGTISATIMLLDDDKLSTELNFSFDPVELKKDAPEQNIEVIATLNGSLLGADYTFPLAFRNSLTSLEQDGRMDVDGDGVVGVPEKANILRRDSGYDASSADLRLRRRRVAGSVDISLEPKNEAGYVAIEATLDEDDQAKVVKGVLSKATVAKTNGYSLLATGIDLNFNGDTGDKYALVPYYSTIDLMVTLREWVADNTPDSPGEVTPGPVLPANAKPIKMSIKIPNPNRGRLTEKVLSDGDITGDEIVDFGAATNPNTPDGRTVSYDLEGEEVPQYVTETQFGIDLNGDGDTLDGGGSGKIVEVGAIAAFRSDIARTVDYFADDPAVGTTQTAREKYDEAIAGFLTTLNKALAPTDEGVCRSGGSHWWCHFSHLLAGRSRLQGVG